MTKEITIDKEEFWDMFEQHPINAVEGLFGKIEMIVNLIKRLEQENKELKEQNRYYKAELKLSCNELDKSNNWQKAERQEKNKYRSVLEEIREIAKDIIENDVYENSDVKAEMILNKINEVLK